MHRLTNGGIKVKKAIISLSSNTYAIKAKKLLLAKGISARVVKVDRGISSQGCGFGIEINYIDYYAVIGELRENGITYSITLPYNS